MRHPEYLIVCYVLLCACMIFLGVYQRRYLDRFSVASIVLMCVSGVCALVFYGRTEFFPAAALGLTAILLIHGMVIHFPLSDTINSCHASFRFRCVCNHETWVLVTAAAGLVSAFRV